MNSNSSRPPSLVTWFCLTILLPAVIIGGSGFFTLVRDLRLREWQILAERRSALQTAAADLENAARSEITRAFHDIPPSLAAADSAPGTAMVDLSEWLWRHPIAAYPFVMDGRRRLLLPQPLTLREPALILRDTRRLPLAAFLQEGERQEFNRRDYLRALYSYLSIPPQKLTLSERCRVDEAVARCYFKLQRYRQALAYYEAVVQRESVLTPADIDLSLLCRRQIARCHLQAGRADEAYTAYLALYKAVAQYEAASRSGRFHFYAVEAMDFLHSGGSKGAATSAPAPSEPEMRLWHVRNRSLLNIEMEPPERESADSERHRFLKLQEIYHPSGMETQYYQHLRDIPLPPADAAAPEIAHWPDRFSGASYLVVYRRLAERDTTVPLYVGFRLEPGELFQRIRDQWAAAAARSRLVLRDAQGGARFPAAVAQGLERIAALPLATFPGWSLELHEHEAESPRRQARREIRLFALLFFALVLALLGGGGLVLHLMRRETEFIRRQTQFIDRAAHTLKTPLTRIRLLAERLHLDWLPDAEKRRACSARLLGECDQTEALITRMLEFSALRQGRRTFRFQSISPMGPVQRVLDRWEPLLQERECTLIRRLDPTVPSLPLDAAAVETALDNLLDNAVKFSGPGGTVTIEVYSANDAVCLAVADNGPGIDPAERQHLFQPFARADRTAAGHGLGLFIVREIAHAHRGAVDFTNLAAGGCRFVLTFPLPPRSTPDAHHSAHRG